MKRLKYLVVVAGALVATALDVHAQCADGSPPPCATVRLAARATPVPSAAERARRFLILPFRNVSRQQAQDWIVEGSTTMISDALGRWQGITVVPDEKLYPALKRVGVTPGAVVDEPHVRRIAEETGGWTAVTGEVLASGGRVRITARAWDVPTNRQVVRASSEVQTGGDVREAFDSLSLKLLHSIGVDSLPADLANSTTRDLDAYRAYLSGLAHMRRAELKSALADFNEAIKRDSSFALAWARLAELTMNADPTSIMNPMSRAAQYSAKAVALSAKLPPRQRSLVLATNSQFTAQFSETRRLLEELLRADSNDVDALQAYAALNQFDPIIVSANGGVRPRGSFNAAARAAKRAIELDPARHVMYANLASIYAQAGIPGVQPVIAIDRTPTSFGDLIQIAQQREHLRLYVAVLRDSIVLVPYESLSVIPKDTLKALRQKARKVARSWAERWIAVAPDEATAHQLMSELYAYDAEYPAALREVAIAESLHVQTPTWSAPSRRMVYLSKSGDIAAATRLADSLTSAGFFTNPNNLLVGGDAAAWSFALDVLHANVTTADTLMVQSTRLRRMFGSGGMPPEFVAFVGLMGNEDPETEPAIPREFRGRQLDSVLAHLPAFSASRVLGPWLPMILPMLAEVADTTKRRIPEVVKAADAIAGRGRPDLAYEIASNSVASDSTVETQAATYAWYRVRADSLNAARRETMARFKPSSASVAADRAVYEWRVNDSLPFLKNRAIVPAGRAEYRVQVQVNAGDRYYRAYASTPPKAGNQMTLTLQELFAPTAMRAVIAGKLTPAGIMADTTRLAGAGLRIEFAPGILRLVVTDTAILNSIRRARPAQAQFRFEPCVHPVGVVGKEECVDEKVPIVYP